jgi:hypothetical protein
MQSLKFGADIFTESIEFAASQHRGQSAASVTAGLPGVIPIHWLRNVSCEKAARTISGSVVILFAPVLEFGLGCIENVFDAGIDETGLRR